MSRFEQIMNERFGKDSLIALATAEGGVPHVRTINAVWHEGAFYGVTHRLSGKMRQIAENPVVAVCGDWFTGHGRGECLGHILSQENCRTAAMLRSAFASWYGSGHINEQDPDTCILKITLADGVLMAHGERIEYP